MPWKMCKLVDGRLKFVARFLDGEHMAGLCREFGIPRKTGYKILGRYLGSAKKAQPAERCDGSIHRRQGQTPRLH